MGKNVTRLLEPLTFELIRSTIWNVAVNAEEVTLPGYVFQVWLAALKRGINRTTVLKKAPSPSWAGGGVSTGQRF